MDKMIQNFRSNIFRRIFRYAIQGNVVGKMKGRGSQQKVLFVVYTNSSPVVNGLVELPAHREETMTI